MLQSFFKRVSQAPTNPSQHASLHEFDIGDLYRGPVAVAESESGPTLLLDEKLRQAYFWIVNHAVISPFYDIEYNEGPAQSYPIGERGNTVVLPSGQSYCSFVLLPLLTFAVALSAYWWVDRGVARQPAHVLMGVLAGYPIQEVRRAIQKGQPQMTIADLLGNPLPSDLIKATEHRPDRHRMAKMAEHACKNYR